MVLPFFNFRDAQYKTDTSLLKVPATEQTNSQLDKDIRGHLKNSPAGEITWQGEQQIDEACNENTQHCANCHLLESEYGRVLFERDLAQRNLKLASYRPGNDLQRQKNKESNGMVLTLFPSFVFYLLSNLRLVPNPPSTPGAHWSPLRILQASLSWAFPRQYDLLSSLAGSWSAPISSQVPASCAAMCRSHSPQTSNQHQEASPVLEDPG